MCWNSINKFSKKGSLSILQLKIYLQSVKCDLYMFFVPIISRACVPSDKKWDLNKVLLLLLSIIIYYYWALEFCVFHTWVIFSYSCCYVLLSFFVGSATFRKYNIWNSIFSKASGKCWKYIIYSHLERSLSLSGIYIGHYLPLSV